MRSHRARGGRASLGRGRCPSASPQNHAPRRGNSKPFDRAHRDDACELEPQRFLVAPALAGALALTELASRWQVEGTRKAGPPPNVDMTRGLLPAEADLHHHAHVCSRFNGPNGRVIGPGRAPRTAGSTYCDAWPFTAWRKNHMPRGATQNRCAWSRSMPSASPYAPLMAYRTLLVVAPGRRPASVTRRPDLRA